MKKGILFALVAVLGLAFVCAVPAFAGNNLNGNGMPQGPHYNLNIIGVEHAKTAKMNGSNSHTIFVALGKNGTVKSSIWLLPATADTNDFQVCDGNGFDAAYDCDGNQIKPSGAVFMLPCDTFNGDVVETCADAGVYGTSYQIYVRELGTPGGSATMDLCATYNDVTYCNSDYDLDVQLSRDTGKPKTQNVTRSLTVLKADTGSGVASYNLFTDNFYDWVWDYYNHGLRLAQLRFYLDQ